MWLVAPMLGTSLGGPGDVVGPIKWVVATMKNISPKYVYICKVPQITRTCTWQSGYARSARSRPQPIGKCPSGPNIGSSSSLLCEPSSHAAGRPAVVDAEEAIAMEAASAAEATAAEAGGASMRRRKRHRQAFIRPKNARRISFEFHITPRVTHMFQCVTPKMFLYQAPILTERRSLSLIHI